MPNVFITTEVAGQVCGISNWFARYLVDAGLVGGAKRNGNRRQVPYDAALAIAALPAADLSAFTTPEIAVLRTAPAENPTEVVPRALARSSMGFDAALKPADLLEALNRWWRCDPARVAAGEYLPVTVGTFCVAVLAGLDNAVSLWTGNDRRWHFPKARLLGHVSDLASVTVHHAPGLTAQEKAAATALLARRLEAESGGPIAYVATPAGQALGQQAALAAPASGEEAGR
jgi:hypothetical protein